MSTLVASLFLSACASASSTPVPAEPVRASEAQAAADPVCSRDAVVLVVDKSGSMTGEPLEQAKAGAKRVFATLGRDDCFSLVAFDSKAGRVVTLAPAADRVTVETAIDGLSPGGGTEFTGALDIALQDLRAAQWARRKVVLFVTDGQAPKAGIEALVASMAAEKIRVSTVGLGGAVDETMLQMIADRTNGRLHRVAAPADLPKILEEEALSRRP